jgi:plastocyanin
VTARLAPIALTLSIAAALPPAAQSTGTIRGVVATAVPSPRPVRVTFDQQVCGTGVADESLVVDGRGGVAGAVITVAGVKGAAPAAAGVINEHCRFSPHVQVVSPRATITTTSTDAVVHTTNALLENGRALFNVALPVAGMKITKAVGGAGLVRLTCNTHPWMRGWIVVTDERAAVSGNGGAFELRDLPAGTYELRLWHETLKAAPQRVTVVAGRVAGVNWTLR